MSRRSRTNGARSQHRDDFVTNNANDERNIDGLLRAGADELVAAIASRVDVETALAEVMARAADGDSFPPAPGSNSPVPQQQSIGLLGTLRQRVRARLAALLGWLTAGLPESMRNVATAAAKGINRAERTAWRDRQAEWDRQLRQAFLHDRLTGLPNRARLASWLGEVLREPPRCERLGVCLIDLDRFKVVNASFGHDNGDQLLRSVALRLRYLADQSGYFLAHLGVDEFVLVVQDTTNSDDMIKVADLVLRILREPFTINGHQFTVSASVGIVERAAAGVCPDELLRTADITLGWSKADPRGHPAVFDPDRYKSEVRRHELTADMPAALVRGEFTLVYQPVFRLADQRITEVEALARWYHPTHGTISPAQFIPLAERTGLIAPLGLHLLDQACRQAVSWRRHRDSLFRISVNLGVAQLRIPELAAAVIATLERTGLPADRLQFEITEGTIVDAPGAALDNLHALGRIGIRLVIDDFGAGYSSLAYLADLPIHGIKLAHGFLRGLDNSTHPNSIILPALISLSHDLGLTVTAAGVETAAQVRRLTALGCDFGQGFHLGGPTTAGHIVNCSYKAWMNEP
jgi:diguanylate cyclase (GGDEF)-like protein